MEGGALIGCHGDPQLSAQYEKRIKGLHSGQVVCLNSTLGKGHPNACGQIGAASKEEGNIDVGGAVEGDVEEGGGEVVIVQLPEGPVDVGCAAYELTPLSTKHLPRSSTEGRM